MPPGLSRGSINGKNFFSALPNGKLWSIWKIPEATYPNGL
jgi:hypothetical protein